MNELEKITIKYHKHLEEDAKEGMMYFTLEDVHKCMKEYSKSKSDCISNVINRYMLFRVIDYYPSGGLSDCVGRYNTIDDAKKDIVIKEYYEDYYVYDRILDKVVLDSD